MIRFVFLSESGEIVGEAKVLLEKISVASLLKAELNEKGGKIEIARREEGMMEAIMDMDLSQLNAPFRWYGKLPAFMNAVKGKKYHAAQ